MLKHIAKVLLTAIAVLLTSVVVLAQTQSVKGTVTRKR